MIIDAATQLRDENIFLHCIVPSYVRPKNYYGQVYRIVISTRLSQPEKFRVLHSVN